MKYLYALIDLVNNYDGSLTIENQMRDLICFLSENEELSNNVLYKTVIFEAAERLRVFGYVKGGNKISVEEFATNGVYDIKQLTIQNYYSSKIFQNNILDKKQKQIIDKFMSLEKKRLLISAPTSFGKTFILREILFLNQMRYRNILLVFPTIALLNENTENMKDLIHALKADYKIVNNVYSSIDSAEKHIFILTPERVLKLLSDHEKLEIDFFFFDEVYKIDEDFSVDEDSAETNNTIANEKPKSDRGNRAKAFRIALYLLTRKVKEFYLAGPYLNLENSKDGLKQYIQKNSITTMQVEFEPTMRIEIDAWKKQSFENHPILGISPIALYSKGSPSTLEKIVGIIQYINNNDLGQSVFYCSTPGNSMSYVKKVVDALPTKSESLVIDQDFIDHLKQKYGILVSNVTSNTAEHWSLVRALENGYGIHHGKFPKYIQNEILKMFNQKRFRHLFCTSTIIEGVNTNAKNVVIINNSVGAHTMSAFALKNIKGRAGRYYHHYSGRVFYTDEKQREIESTHDLQLNFPTYSANNLLDVDFDNTELSDLSISNQKIKTTRDKTLNFDFLPDHVFIKNRLYARDIQEKYLSFLLKPDHFNKFNMLINNSSNIRLFLDQKTITSILETFESCGIIEQNKAKVYHSVVAKYSIDGTRGIIKYHIDNHIKQQREKSVENALDTIDRAYVRSFDQIRNIVEYEVPKLLCLFEAIFSFAGTIKGHDMTDFNMSTIIRFFELGVTTEFGLSLVEYGFPVDTIRTLEKEFKSLSTLSTLDSIAYLRERSQRVIRILDVFELNLFKSAIKALER